jgi:hypothetical protein
LAITPMTGRAALPGIGFRSLRRLRRAGGRFPLQGNLVARRRGVEARLIPVKARSRPGRDKRHGPQAEEPPMSHTPHELADELPEHAESIRARKAADPHFAKLADRYHHINREIHRGETNVEPMDDFHLEELKKQRLALLDQLKGMLAA